MTSLQGLLPGRLTAGRPGWTTSAEVVVVGSGIAGLTAALRLRDQVEKVLVVTKDVLAAGSTQWAQGGIAAALGPGDTPDQHERDTLVAGAGACDAEAAGLREETRGSHWRDDFPARDDARWAGHVDARLTANGLDPGFHPAPPSDGGVR